MDFKEFQAFGRTNPVFLAVGHRMQTKLRHKLFGRQYWLDQTRKRKDRYNSVSYTHLTLPTKA